MTRKEHLLLIAMEECNEVAHRISKALRFTLEEVQPGQDFNNAERIIEEWIDLQTVMRMLLDEVMPESDQPSEGHFTSMMAAKRAKIEKFLKYSKEKGTL